jgi:phospholipid N-methyltransferase
MNFLVQALSRPGRTGAIAPSSQRLARLIAGRADLGAARMVVELGPGTGAFTAEIAARLGPDTDFFTLEINPAFAEAMRARFAQVRTITGSATDLAGHLQALGHQDCDRIVCGLPWTAFAPELQETILSGIVAALAPGALFLTFAYNPLHHLPRGRSFQRKLEQHFQKVETTRTVLNLPPAFVYVCTK